MCPWPKGLNGLLKGQNEEVYNHPGVLTVPGLGGNCTLEAKRRELRDSETFSSRGEMFTNMSLWREDRGPNPSISGWVDTVASFPPLTPASQSPPNPSVCPFHSHLSAATQRVLQQVGELAVPVRNVGLLEG